MTPLNHTHKFLLVLDTFPLDGIWRIAAGTAVFPIERILFGRNDSIAASFAALLGVLFLTRLIPLLTRKLIPFPPSIQQAWQERRATAKRFDSYQLKKLLWIGIGMFSYIEASSRFWVEGVLIASACVLIGALGMLRWRFISSRTRPQYSQAA